ncbi:MAG: TonB-dependent receptor [Halioglobus sp.]
MQNYKKSVIATALVALTAGGSALVSAQALEEVLVTAQKRVEGMQDVPISIAVVSGEMIQNSGITNLEELTLYLPAVNVSQSGGQTQIFIRGIGSGNNIGFEQSVGTFVDGVYFGRARNARAAFLDVERVEVLKGPQSTLFGKNTVAGAINITTRGPTEEFEGYLEGSYETEIEQYGLTGAVSGPLSDNVRGRLVAKYSDSEGYMENQAPGGEDGPQKEQSVIRGALSWDITDRLLADFKAETGSIDTEGKHHKITISTPTANYLFGFGDDPNFESSLGFNTKQSVSGSPARRDFDENDWDIYQATLTYEMDNHTLKSITAWTEYEVNKCLDGDYAPVYFLDQCNGEENEQFTQEFILSSNLGGSFEYLAGFFYQDSDLTSTTDTHLRLSGIPPIEAGVWGLLGTTLPVGAMDSGVLAEFEQNTESWSVFGQFTYDFTDRFRGTVGVRYSEDDKEADSVQLITALGGTEPSGFHTALLGPGGLNFRVPYDYNIERSEDHVTGSMNLQYDIGDDTMIYFTASNGFKAGGFDESNGLDISREFEDESVLNFEVGAKMEFWDNRARLNSAIFNTSFDDLQVSSFESATFIVTNAGEATVQGVELDGVVAVTDKLELRGALTWLDAEYDEYDEAACTVDQIIAQGNPCRQDLGGTPLQFAPDWSGNIGATYETGLTANTDILFGLAALYSDDVLIMPDGDKNGIQESFWKVDARVAWSASDGSWTLALIGKNLTDEDVFSWGNDATLSGSFLGFEQAYFHQMEKPRTYEFQARYNF